MAKNKSHTTYRDPLPENFNSLEEFWAFWDAHSTADYEDDMEDVEVRINLRSNKVYYALANDLAKLLQHHARQQGVSPQTLINLWLREKITEQAQVHRKKATARTN